MKFICEIFGGVEGQLPPLTLLALSLGQHVVSRHMFKLLRYWSGFPFYFLTIKFEKYYVYNIFIIFLEQILNNRSSKKKLSDKLLLVIINIKKIILIVD